MNSQLIRALERFNERKSVIASSADEDDLTDIRLMFTGCDVSYGDLMEVADHTARLALTALVTGEAEIVNALMGQWIDGYLSCNEFHNVRYEQAANSSETLLPLTSRNFDTNEERRAYTQGFLDAQDAIRHAAR
jgi:hypothetical protein